MRKIIIIYGLALAVLAMLLRTLEFRFFMHDLSTELYISCIATVFAVLGIWVGTKLVQKRKVTEAPAMISYSPGGEQLQENGISKREYEVLELMALGCSNQEIADRLFISLSTVKTHSANLYSKLDVKRRTQAVQKAKELNIIQQA